MQLLTEDFFPARAKFPCRIFFLVFILPCRWAKTEEKIRYGASFQLEDTAAKKIISSDWPREKIEDLAKF